MGLFRAVLFDWRGMLVFIPPPEWVVERALAAIDRPGVSADVRAVTSRVECALRTPEWVEAEASIDSLPGVHHGRTMALFALAGLDEELAEALYVIEWDLASRPAFPDVIPSLTALRERGLKIGVVSDIHFDIRADCAAQGIDPFIDAYALSIEHGIQKPDPSLFQIALDQLEVAPDEALMVGDTAATDGGATSLGIPTLILPRMDVLAPRGLDLVLGLIAPTRPSADLNRFV